MNGNGANHEELVQIGGRYGMSARRGVSAQTEAEVEHLLGDSIDRIASIDERLESVEEHTKQIPDIKALLASLAASQSMSAQAQVAVAATLEKTEQRMRDNEVRYDTLATRDHVPLSSHKWTVIMACVPTVILAICSVAGVLYFTGQNMKATATSLEITTKKVEENERSILEAKREVEAVKEKVEDKETR